MSGRAFAGRAMARYPGRVMALGLAGMAGGAAATVSVQALPFSVYLTSVLLSFGAFAVSVVVGVTGEAEARRERESSLARERQGAAARRHASQVPSSS